MSEVWFTADLHIGHRLVAGHRGFDYIDEHDHAIYGNWSRAVKPDDTVWVLGDLAVTSSREKLTTILATLASLPGHKHLIAGNHDPIHPMFRDAHKWHEVYRVAFESVQPFARRKHNGQDVLLSHFPYSADRGEVRYSQYRLRNEGVKLLHGHTHSKEQRPSATEIHIGVDAWDLAPVSLNATLAAMLGER